MAWNEPGGDRDPWRGRRNEQGPPDLDEIVKNLQRRLSGVFGGGKSPKGGGSGIGLGLILIVALVLWAASGFFIVHQGERGVVLRFGERQEVVGPGLHWHLPYPIEKRVLVNVEKVFTLELGRRTTDKGVTRVPKEALMLTGDENIIDIEFAIQYRIRDPMEYLFNISDPSVTLYQVAESAVREVVGKSTLDFVLTSGRAEVEQATKAIMQATLDHYKAGLNIVAVEMQRALPPDEVKAAFDDAVRAREDEVRQKNEAEAYYNDVIPRARGEAARLAHEAQGYKQSVIARAEGDARRFNQIVAEYKNAPAVTRERLYIEAMEQVLSSTSKILVDQKSGNSLMYLPVDRLMSGKSPVTDAESPASQQLESVNEQPERSRDRPRDRSTRRSAP